MEAVIERSNLTKEQIQHLAVSARCETFSQLKDNFEMQAKLRILFPKTEPCWECKAIAEKLGFPV